MKRARRWLYWVIFGNGLAYRSPFWYDAAEWLKGKPEVTDDGR